PALVGAVGIKNNRPPPPQTGRQVKKLKILSLPPADSNESAKRKLKSLRADAQFLFGTLYFFVPRH
ncbi:MAG: hypothetical protein LH472_11880, partial [Pyrinomonadaceae bacterium]|nr:hypothetical protein [Pyrinomonadaceae bacterium]